MSRSNDPWGVGPNGVTYMGNDVPHPQSNADYAFQLSIYSEKIAQVACKVAYEMGREMAMKQNEAILKAILKGRKK